jgi:hypothetical protein
MKQYMQFFVMTSTEAQFVPIIIITLMSTQDSNGTVTSQNIKQLDMPFFSMMCTEAQLCCP